MGKITDAAVAMIVLIIGLYILTKLGLTFGDIWSMFRNFFSNPSPTNSTAGLLGIASNAKLRAKIRERREWIMHMIRVRQLKGAGRR